MSDTTETPVFPMVRVTEPIKPGSVVAIVGFGFQPSSGEPDEYALAAEQMTTLMGELSRVAGHDQFTVIVAETPADVRVFPASLTLDEIEKRLRD